ncbi:LamG domain-containing protein [Salinibacterium sp. SYSU T00001]|uniref:LamG domain-containing protein n=1 Tax=Homoserinimonas sedimenticola TaxID=2986805 RepID=UPI00223658AC|nr:LamG domain-containing protein [Salinibacterium sedimenticola]MCW4384188.1 LamG domain-containing protein [Salinibacterium sedimenticola]
MTAWLVARWRPVLIGVVVVALLVSVGVVVMNQPQQTPAAAEVDCSALMAETFEEAGPLARECDTEVEVLAERTPWQTSWATSDSSARLEVSALPSRVEVDGEWVDLDPELAVDEESGAVTVIAPVFPMELNPGGSAGEGQPLGTIRREGKQLSVWFPLDLPVPDVTGSQAVYSIAEGIRLVVSINADATGFLPVVELADREAADRFEALVAAARAESGVETNGAIHFATAVSEGLTLSLDAENALHVADAEGETHFVAPPPTMWDSSGEDVAANDEVGATDRTRSPAGGDRIELMDVSLIETTIAVTPNEDMLTSASTVWPVYVDPGFNGWGASWWVAVRTGGYNNTLHHWGDISASSLGQGTGYCTNVSACNTVFKQRLAWQFSGLNIFTSITDTDVLSAQFRVYGSYSASCNAYAANLYHVTSIGAGTTWGNIPWGGLVSTRTESQRAGCAAGGVGYRDFDATGVARWSAAYNLTTAGMGIVVSEADISTWKRYRADATFSMTYNRAPNTPTGLQLTNPLNPGCVSGASRPVVATTNPVLSAISKDPDGDSVRTSFVVVEGGNSSAVKWSSGNLAALASGSRANAAVPSGLEDGKMYSWRARAYDGARYSAYTAWCQFSVDVTKPDVPEVSRVITGVEAQYPEGEERGGVGLQGKFLLERGVSTDVKTYLYGFNDPTTPTSVAADATSGTATVSFTPTTTGPVTLTVKSRDAAGNVSSPRTYIFDVGTPAEDAIWPLDEGSGSTAINSVEDSDADLTLYGGAGWGQGPLTLFDSRQGDNALAFDGIDDFAATAGPVVDNSTSYTVSAFVRLDSAHVKQGKNFTAVGQDGQDYAEFALGYVDSCSGTNGCWSFSVFDGASDTGANRVNIPMQAAGDEWALLVGEYDAGDNKLRLRVCEVGTPQSPTSGDPVKAEASRWKAAPEALGAFTVGRGQLAGVPASFWPGSVDNVRVFKGAVLAESKIRRMCHGAEATDFGGSDIALDPTEAAEQ